MREDVLRYLGYPQDIAIDEHTERLIERALREMDEIAEFKYVYAYYDEPQKFMLNHPAYMDYLAGSEGYLLCACTIGIGVDRRLKRLQVEDMSYAVVFDAVAGAYVEHKADGFEQDLPYRKLGFRFCPGYQNTPLEDNRLIANGVRADKIGISFLDSGLMIPMKSMTGIVRIGGDGRKSCTGCVAREGCGYRRLGLTCYNDERVNY